MNSIHAWLLSHPIWQSVLINTVVGIVLLVLGASWKFISAFAKVPPQRIGLWVKKAKLNSYLRRLYQFQKALDDARYAHFLIIRLAALCLLFLAYMVANVGILIANHFLPSRLLPRLTPSLLVLPDSANRALHMATFLFPLLLIGIMSVRMTAIAMNLAFPERYLRRLTSKIEEINGLPARSQHSKVELADPDEQAIDDKTDETAFSSVYEVGMRVRHRNYGIGQIIEKKGQGKDEIVGIRFRDGTSKRFVARFARLDIV